MRSILLSCAILSIGAIPGHRAEAQPADGDVIISVLGSPNLNTGKVLYFDPNNASVIGTLASNDLSSSFHNFLRMAPNNLDVMVAEVASGLGYSNLTSFDPAGIATTIAQTLIGPVNGMELDGDDTWIASSSQSFLYGVTMSGVVTTFAQNATQAWNEIAILREQGYDYVMANFSSVLTTEPKLLAANRQGVHTTLMNTAGPPLNRLSGIETDPRTGTFITTDFEGPSSANPEPNGVEINRVTSSGTVTTLVSFGANGSKVNQDDTIWIGGFVMAVPANVPAVIRYDLANNSVVTIVQLPTLGQTYPLSAVEVYGSHPLTVNGQGGPGQSIAISVNSQNPFVARHFYQLACSFARRPGIRFSQTGEWLHLNVTDNLFLLTSQNLAPSIFRNFTGQLDALGSARATIRLPGSFPANLGLTVFCAGIVFDQTGSITQVLNTHWFEL